MLECGLEEEDGSVGVERSKMVRGSKTAVLKGLPEVERRYWDPAGIANARICHSLVGCGQNYTCFEIYARVTSHSPLLLSPYILPPSSCFLSSLILGPILVALLASTCFTPSIRAPSSLTPSLSLCLIVLSLFHFWFTSQGFHFIYVPPPSAATNSPPCCDVYRGP